MAKDAQTWRIEIDDFMEENVIGEVLKVQRKMMMELLTQVVQNTPVGNRARWKRNIERKAKGLKGLLPRGYVGGHARKNWQVKINQKPVNTVNGEDKSGNGNETITRGGSQIAKIKEPCVAYISNLLPYIDRLEKGNWSKSAPNGIAKPAVQAIRNKYRKV